MIHLCLSPKYQVLRYGLSKVLFLTSPFHDLFSTLFTIHCHDELRHWLGAFSLFSDELMTVMSNERYVDLPFHSSTIHV
jgi:hypothetical protein